jgi:hypothetical protein
MIVATYKIQDKNPRIFATVTGPAKWRIEIYHALDGVIETHVITPKQRCNLSELLPLAVESIEELLADMPTVDDAGFIVTRLR